jgi:hypothetical protein
MEHLAQVGAVGESVPYSVESKTFFDFGVRGYEQMGEGGEDEDRECRQEGQVAWDCHGSRGDIETRTLGSLMEW